MFVFLCACLCVWIVPIHFLVSLYLGLYLIVCVVITFVLPMVLLPHVVMGSAVFGSWLVCLGFFVFQSCFQICNWGDNFVCIVFCFVVVLVCWDDRRFFFSVRSCSLFLFVQWFSRAEFGSVGRIPGQLQVYGGVHVFVTRACFGDLFLLFLFAGTSAMRILHVVVFCKRFTSPPCGGQVDGLRRP